MSQTLTEKPIVPISVTDTASGERKGLTKKEIAADHPTWCPGCGDLSPGFYRPERFAGAD